mmetsp:Transcript_13379/g.22775  ORF Transcript_13379/g.22775 Transcript_13379/m.22775 type:complete len:99 (+) Transcript_13379:17-313(+)
MLRAVPVSIDIQNLVNENYGFMPIGRTGHDNIALYNHAMEGGDPIAALGLRLQDLDQEAQLQNLKFNPLDKGLLYIYGYATGDVDGVKETIKSAERRR